MNDIVKLDGQSIRLSRIQPIIVTPGLGGVPSQSAVVERVLDTVALLRNEEGKEMVFSLIELEDYNWGRVCWRERQRHPEDVRDCLCWACWYWACEPIIGDSVRVPGQPGEWIFASIDYRYLVCTLADGSEAVVQEEGCRLATEIERSAYWAIRLKRSDERILECLGYSVRSVYGVVCEVVGDACGVVESSDDGECKVGMGEYGVVIVGWATFEATSDALNPIYLSDAVKVKRRKQWVELKGAESPDATARSWIASQPVIFGNSLVMATVPGTAGGDTGLAQNSVGQQLSPSYWSLRKRSGTRGILPKSYADTIEALY